MSKSRAFPVLWQGDRKYLARLHELNCPRSVPWQFIARHAEACQHNHDQTPERLAERGGLAPSEMVAVVLGRRFKSMTPEQEVGALLDLLQQFYQT